MDLVYIQNFRQKDLINISLLDRRKIISAVKDDVAFLCSQNLMDYSLLVAVEQIQGNQSPETTPTNRYDFLTFSEEEKGILEDMQKNSVKNISDSNGENSKKVAKEEAGSSSMQRIVTVAKTSTQSK